MNRGGTLISVFLYIAPEVLFRFTGRLRLVFDPFFQVNAQLFCVFEMLGSDAGGGRILR